MAVITISRQYGSGGNEAASRVSELLGYRSFDKSLMSRVASEVGLSEAEVVDFSERAYKPRTFLDRLFGLVGVWAGESGIVARVSTWKREDTGAETEIVQMLDDEQSVAMVKQTILAAYGQGNLVIVGRGGQAILKGKPGVLHVRIEAPLAARAERIRQHEDCSIETATQRATQQDGRSAGYLRRFYGIDWSDPMLYHLVVNTGMWDLEDAAGLIVQASEYCMEA